MARMPKKVVPYNFDPGFERIVVYLTCSSPKFYGRVGYALDPALFKSLPAQRAIEGAHQINKDSGHGPAKALFVLQRLRRWMADGKITLEVIKQVADLFDEAEDAGLPEEDGVIGELAPMLKERVRDEAVEAAVASYGKHGDLSDVIELANKAQRIGEVDTSVGTILGSESFEEIVKLKDLVRLPLGVTELDSVLDGGLQNGGLGIFIGGSGDGKSMGLSHVSGVNLVDGLFICYATLELPKEIVLARVKANITGVPINTMLNGEIEEARARLESISHRLGRLVVQEFAPKTTTFEDIKHWVENCEAQAGRKVDLLVVDYGDKLGAKAKKGEQLNEYTGALHVFESMRTFAHERKIFCWTASQASRQKDRKKRLDLNDVADSMHKVRVADLVVTLNLRDDGADSMSITFFIAKHRTGVANKEIGPMPTEYERGRLCPIVEPT